MPVITSPVVLFVYNRLWHTQQTVEALSRNELADQTDLVIYSDGPKGAEVSQSVREVRAYIKQIRGFRSVSIHERPDNLGLAQSVVSGVTELLKQYETVIVMEDDMVTSPYFLRYMNDALVCYVDNDEVISIHGYVYPVDRVLPETFFLAGADCWGWATWRRGWALFNPNGKELLENLQKKQLMPKFDYNGSYPYSRMLKRQIKALNDSWAIRWYASALAAGKLTLYPGRSLVHNIGNDSSGTHCVANDYHDVALSLTPISLESTALEESSAAREAFEEFFRRSHRSLFRRVFPHIRARFHKLVGAAH